MEDARGSRAGLDLTVGVARAIVTVAVAGRERVVAELEVLAPAATKLEALLQPERDPQGAVDVVARLQVAGGTAGRVLDRQPGQHAEVGPQHQAQAQEEAWQAEADDGRQAGSPTPTHCPNL